jgi:hypothetical protein
MRQIGESELTSDELEGLGLALFVRHFGQLLNGYGPEGGGKMLEGGFVQYR